MGIGRERERAMRSVCTADEQHVSCVSRVLGTKINKVDNRPAKQHNKYDLQLHKKYEKFTIY